MEQFFEFVVNHWLLWLAFVFLIIALLRLEMSNQVGGVTLLSPQQSVDLINRENAVVVDVRSKEEFAKGHIIGSVHIPLDNLEDNLKKLNKYKKRPVIVNCERGQRSMKAGAILRKNGFETVASLKGGLQAWRQANLPLKAA